MDVLINLHEVQNREGCKGQERKYDFRPTESLECELFMYHRCDRCHDAHPAGNEQEDDFPPYSFNQSMYLTYTSHGSETNHTI